MAPLLWLGPFFFHLKKVVLKEYKFYILEVSRPHQFKSKAKFHEVVKVKAYDIVGKFINKENNLIVEILIVDYKCFNHVFNIGNIFMVIGVHLHLEYQS